MRKHAFLLLVAVLFAAAAVFGLYHRQSYTDVTAEPNYLDRLVVGEMPQNIGVDVCRMMRAELPTAKLIVRVTPVAEPENHFHMSQQKVAVKEIFAGSGLSVGDEIYLTAENWQVVAQARERPLSLNWHYVNVLRVGEDYLAFLKGYEGLTWQDIPVYYLRDRENMVTIAPVFCYGEIDNVCAVPKGGASGGTYVPYAEVRDNEFFGTTDATVEAWEELKVEMLARYPAGQ